MRKLGRAIAFILAASALAAPVTAFAEPIKDQGPVLIRVEGHEVTYGDLASPQHAIFDYTLAVTARGEGVLSSFLRRPNFSGESLDDPPRVSVIRFRLTAPELAQLQRQVSAAKLGRQNDCHSYVQFFAYTSASEAPKQRLVWFGSGRRHEFAAWQGDECGPEVTALLRALAGIAKAAYALPTER